MTNASHLPADISKFAVLVNQDRLRSSIKRLFSNQIDEVLSELFQNSQRSNSTLVEITTTENSVTIQDNGHGLIDGIDGFHTLLKLAESNFENETIVDQDPMGLGIVSLLTHDQVSEVTFSSGSLQLSIETDRWWNDSDYYSTWFDRLVTLDQQTQDSVLLFRAYLSSSNRFRSLSLQRIASVTVTASFSARARLRAMMAS